MPRDTSAIQQRKFRKESSRRVQLSISKNIPQKVGKKSKNDPRSWQVCLSWCASSRIQLKGIRDSETFVPNFSGIFAKFSSQPRKDPRNSANKGLPLPLGRWVCETKSKNGGSRPRSSFISRVFCAQRGIETMVSDHGLGRGQTMG